MNYVIVECDCQRDQVAVLDEAGEDCRLWDRQRELMAENERCEDCGKMPSVGVAYQEMQEADRV